MTPEAVETTITMKYDQSAKFVTFQLAEEDYGIQVTNVKEIVGMLRITQIPGMPGFVRGVVNLRGKVIPVIDLRRRFDMEPRAYDIRTPIIVVELEDRQGISLIGMVVDSVSEVLNIPPRDIEEPPSFGIGVDTSFMLGMAKTSKGVKSLLDIKRILTKEYLEVLDGFA